MPARYPRRPDRRADRPGERGPAAGLGGRRDPCGRGFLLGGAPGVRALLLDECFAATGQLDLVRQLVLADRSLALDGEGALLERRLVGLLLDRLARGSLQARSTSGSGPGGFVHVEEDLSAAAYRELAEETGVVTGVHLEQLATYGDPSRDPRMRTVSVAWLALAPDLVEPVAGSDASGAEWMAVDQLDLDTLAFDHERILRDGIERARAKIEYTPIATAFCGPEFTVAQLRGVYEAVWGHTLDPRNFHRKVTGTPGFFEKTGATTNVDGGRPARLYRRGRLDVFTPPLTR